MKLRSSSLPPTLRQDAAFMHKEMRGGEMELLTPRHTTTQHPASLSRNLSAPLPILDSLADSDHLVRPRKFSFKDTRPSESKKLESLLSDVPSARTYTIAARNSGVVLSSSPVDSHADFVQLRQSLIESGSWFPRRQDSVKRLVLKRLFKRYTFTGLKVTVPEAPLLYQSLSCDTSTRSSTKLRSSSLPPTLRQDAAFMHKEMRGGEMDLLTPRHATSDRPASLSRNLSAPLPILDSLADSDHLVRPRKSSFKDTRPSESKKLESLLSDEPSARAYTIAARNSGVVLSSSSFNSHAADFVQLRKSSSRDTNTNLSTWDALSLAALEKMQQRLQGLKNPEDENSEKKTSDIRLGGASNTPVRGRGGPQHFVVALSTGTNIISHALSKESTQKRDDGSATHSEQCGKEAKILELTAEIQRLTDENKRLVMLDTKLDLMNAQKMFVVEIAERMLLRFTLFADANNKLQAGVELANLKEDTALLKNGISEYKASEPVQS